MTSRARTAAAVLLLVVIGGVACGGSYDSNGPSGPPMTSTILVVNNAFQPLLDTVKVGGTVTWDWANLSADHNIISSGSPAFVGEGNNVVFGVSGTDYFSSPHSYPVTFNTAGSYDFFCSVHGTATTGMKGRIDVLL